MKLAHICGVLKAHLNYSILKHLGLCWQPEIIIATNFQPVLELLYPGPERLKIQNIFFLKRVNTLSGSIISILTLLRICYWYRFKPKFLFNGIRLSYL